MPALLDKIRLTKRDHSDYLFHFTKGPPIYRDESDGIRMMTGRGEAIETLWAILESGSLRGATVLKNQKCVCFTETSLEEILWLMSLPEWDHGRYTFYGIGVSKRWLFANGGRPVIYQPSAERDYLGDANEFRHVTFQLATKANRDVDWTWEREWRIRTDKLLLDPSQTTVICSSATEALKIMTERPGDKNWKAVPIESFVRKPQP